MKIILVTILVGFLFPLHAEQLEVEYASFYNHVRKLDSEELDALQFSFGFKRVLSSKLCQLKSAYIHTQKRDIPVIVSEENRFRLPSEKALKMAKAVVIIDILEPSNQCDMSVQLETKPAFLKTAYSRSELKLLLTQYQEFFSSMGSILSFLMPSADGLNFHFNSESGVLPKPLKFSNGIVEVGESWLHESEGLEFNQTPVRITAKIAN